MDEMLRLYDAKVQIANRKNKKGEPYQKLLINLKNVRTGEYVCIHEVYMSDLLQQLVEFMLRETDEPTTKKQ